MKALLRSAVLSFVFIFGVTGHAQDFNISWGESSKDEGFGQAVQLVNGNYLLLKGQKVGRTIEPAVIMLDQNMQTVKEISFDLAEKGVLQFDLKRFGDNIYLVYEVMSKKEISVYAVRINQQTLKQEAKITLGTFDSYGEESFPDLNLLFKVSPDSSKIALFVKGLAINKGNNEFYNAVFDPGLKKIWGGYNELPFGGFYVTITDHDINNEGELFVAFKKYEKKINPISIRLYDKKVPPYDYNIFVYSQNKFARQVSVNLPGYFVAGTRLVFEKDGATTMAGLYKKTPNGNITGMFYNKFESTATAVNENKLLAFPQDILDLVDKDGMGKRNGSDPGIYDYLQLRQIITRKNGTVDIVSEVETESATTQSNPNQSFYGKTYRRYGYGSIINLNLDKEGHTLFTRIPKAQEGYQNDFGLGYYPFVYDDKLIFFYNDHPDNIDRDLSKSPEHMTGFSKKCVLATAIIDEKGNVTRKSIYDYRDDKRLAITKSFSRLSDSKILVQSITGKFMSFRLGFGFLDIKQ